MKGVIPHVFNARNISASVLILRSMSDNITKTLNLPTFRSYRAKFPCWVPESSLPLEMLILVLDSPTHLGIHFALNQVT